MGLLNPQQKQLVNQMQSQPSEKQAQMIADYCNKNGISKQQLQGLMNMIKK